MSDIRKQLAEVLRVHRKCKAIRYGADYACVGCGEELGSNSMQVMSKHQADVLMREFSVLSQSQKVRQLVRDLVDPDDCWFDHHGGCQAHVYLTLKPGELCPHQEAKDWLENND